MDELLNNFVKVDTQKQQPAETEEHGDSMQDGMEELFGEYKDIEKLPRNNLCRNMLFSTFQFLLTFLGIQ